MKSSRQFVGVGWYLEPPFNKRGAFQSQNWWTEWPWLDEESQKPRRPIPPEAVTYELVRRHPRIGSLLLLQATPRKEFELFMRETARTAWPWLTAQARETWCEFPQPKKFRPAQRLKIISAFEGTEQGRAFDFKVPSAKKRSTPLPRKANQTQRRAFERVCDRALLSLNRS